MKRNITVLVALLLTASFAIACTSRSFFGLRVSSYCHRTPAVVVRPQVQVAPPVVQEVLPAPAPVVVQPQVQVPQPVVKEVIREIPQAPVTVTERTFTVPQPSIVTREVQSSAVFAAVPVLVAPVCPPRLLLRGLLAPRLFPYAADHNTLHFGIGAY
jgi:hypothetical protein